MKARIYLIVILMMLGAMVCFAQTRAPFNSDKYDDKAVGFRQTNEVLEMWFTKTVGTSGSMQLFRVQCQAEGLSKDEQLMDLSLTRVTEAKAVDEKYFDGSPAFVDCKSNYGVFVSNRRYKSENDTVARTYNNDLYEMFYENGKWTVTRMNDTINSDSWDDTPAFSHDGKILYFASTRLDKKTTRYGKQEKACIFYTTRKGDSWSSPELLPYINSINYSQEAPFVGPDGFLYFSTNKNGRFQIWRAKLDDNGLPVDRGEPVSGDEFPGVNTEGSDQTHPAFSPGGSWFIWSSNRTNTGKKGNFDIYWIKLPPKAQKSLTLTTVLRTKEKEQGADSAATIFEPVVIHELSGKAKKTKIENHQGTVEYSLYDNESSYPGADSRVRELLVYVISNSPKYVSSVDTLLIDVSCRGELKHTIFLWDTATYRDPSCTQNFNVYRVRFFITGYWCPTTKLYKKYTSCASLFVDPECMEAPCEDNDAYNFRVQRTNAALCVDYPEFKKDGDKYANEVDSAITMLKQAMESALKIPCVQRAIKKGEKITVKITGYTDPRPINEKCKYTGKDWEEIRTSYIQPNEEIIPFIENGKYFISKGFGGRYGGNQLLSDLRAYYTTLLLDSLWTETIDLYKKLKYNGQLQVMAIGKAISQENTDFARKRSIEASIEAPMQDITIAGHVPDPGTLVLFCKTCEGFEMIPVNAKQARVPVETNYTNIPTPPREPVQAPPKQVKQKPEEKKKPEPVKKEKPKKEEKPVPEVKPTEDLSQTKEAVQKPEEPEQTEVDCPWAVLFGEYRSEAEAQKFKILLEKENFPPVKIVENDYTGVLTYRLLCNCYRDRKKAISELPKIMDKLKALGSQEPRIIKTGD